MRVREDQNKMFGGSIHMILSVQYALNLQKDLLWVGKFDEDVCELSRRKD